MRHLAVARVGTVTAIPDFDPERLIEQLREQWQTNQQLHERVRELEAELVASRELADKLRPGYGHTMDLIRIARYVLAAGATPAPTSADWTQAHAVATEWHRQVTQ